MTRAINTQRPLRRTAMALLLVFICTAGLVAQTPKPAPQRPAVVAAPAPVYYPPRGEWVRRTPDEAGMDAARLQQAVDFALASENPATKDLALDLELTFGMREPLFKIIGPTKPRGGMNGLVIRNGFVVADWGDTARTDMTFSVTKSFLSTVVGLAWQQGLIRDVNDRVKDDVPTPELFESAHNATITWDDLLRQTSDWSGTLWDIPDWADRPEGKTPAEYPNRPMREPGTHYKYNDVHELVPQPGTEGAPQRARVERDVPRQRHQHHLHRLGERSRCGGAVDPGRRRARQVPGDGGGRD